MNNECLEEFVVVGNVATCFSFCVLAQVIKTASKFWINSEPILLYIQWSYVRVEVYFLGRVGFSKTERHHILAISYQD